MAVKELLSSSGRLTPSALNGLAGNSEEQSTVLATFGSAATGALLGDLFGSLSPEPDPKSLSVQNSPAVDSAVLVQPLRHLAVLRGCDSSPRAARLSLALADALLVAIRMHDLSRARAAGITSFWDAFGDVMRLRASEVAPKRGKVGFFVIVCDYEADVLPRKDLIHGFVVEMQRFYEALPRPQRSPERVGELFEFEFITLESPKYCEEKYNAGIANLRAKLRDGVSDNYLFDGGAYVCPDPEGLSEAAEQVVGAMEDEETKDIPAHKELTATFECDNAMRTVFEKYQQSVRMWRRETDGGAILDSFGSAAAKMVDSTLAVFEKDAKAFAGSRAFRRKRDELKELLDADLHLLFVKQIGKLRETTYRRFKDALDEIPESEDNLEKRINAALRDCQKRFREEADRLQPRGVSWRYDNDRKELDTKMREDATERLQLARLAEYQENGVPGRRRRRRARGGMPGKSRQPISVGFHYLDPAPFGMKDSRYEKLNMDDELGYNPPPRSSKAIVGGLGRSGGNNNDGITVPLLPGRDAVWNK